MAKMGRPTIFDRPLTPAEHQERYRERLRAKEPPHNWRVTLEDFLNAMVRVEVRNDEPETPGAK